MEIRKLDIVLISLLLLLMVFNGFLLFYPYKSSQISKEPEVFYSGGMILPEKPSLPGHIPNSDLFFASDGFISSENLPSNSPKEFVKDTMGWKGDAWWSEQTQEIDGRNGFLVSHPFSKDKCRYVETPKFTLPADGYVIIGLANGEGKLDYTGSNPEMADNVFKIYLVDVKRNIKFPLDAVTISSEDGWKDIAYEISKLEIFKESEIQIRVENCAGGKLHPYWGEWGVIDYIDVIS